MGIDKDPTLTDTDTPVVQTIPCRIYLYVVVVICVKFALVYNKVAAIRYNLDGNLGKNSNINITKSSFTTRGNKRRNKGIYIGGH